jgi:mono/diheme cytochrome c family protein
MTSRRLVLAGVGLVAATGAVGAAAQSASSPPPHSTLDVKELFASNCGFCHSDGGRSAGRGPQLMDTQRDDEFIRYRIRSGKEGAMPAFGQMFSDSDIDAIIRYIRALRPEGQG